MGINHKHKPFSYYGGKTWILDEILPYIPPHTVYCEPFAGGASVFWAKPLADLNILNDTNLALYKFYKVASKRPDELIAELETTLYHHEEHRRACDIYRNPEGYSDLEVATAFFVAATQSFSGMVGGTWGRVWDWGLRVKVDSVSPIKRKQYASYRNQISALPILLTKLRNAQIDNMDAVELISRLNKKSKDAFLFVDPPYYNSDCGHYAGYTEQDFVRLLDVLAESPHRWMLTCYPNAHYEGRGGEIRHVGSRNATAKTRNKTEAIITNYKQQRQIALW